MTLQTRVLVVVPCLNEEAALPRLLHQLLGESLGDMLIVVADGGSSDASVAIVEEFARRYPALRLLRNPMRLQSAGVNLAARTFGTDRDWLLRIDAHCEYPDRYAERLLVSAAAHAATSVVVPMITKGESCFQRAAATAQNSVLGTGGSPHRHLGTGRYVDHGHHALFQMAAFNSVGGYDETFSHNEDAELDHRLGAAGARIWLEPEARLIYHPRGRPLQLFRQYLNYGRGRARTVLKHGLKLKMRQAAPLAIAPCLGLFAAGLTLSLVDVRWLVLSLPALSWLGLCQGFAIVLAARRRSFCVLASGSAAAIMHAAWSTGYWLQLLTSRGAVRSLPTD